MSVTSMRLGAGGRGVQVPHQRPQAGRDRKKPPDSWQIAAAALSRARGGSTGPTRLRVWLGRDPARGRAA